MRGHGSNHFFGVLKACVCSAFRGVGVLIGHENASGMKD
jgi:hypothetical protein